MSNYKESKERLNKIRQEYTCKGDVIFTTAVQYVIEVGQTTINNEIWFKNALAEMEKYRGLKEQCPFQYNRAFDNLVHWETVMHALELYEKGHE